MPSQACTSTKKERKKKRKSAVLVFVLISALHNKQELSPTNPRAHRNKNRIRNRAALFSQQRAED